MIKNGSFFIDSVNILVERRFCQEIQYRIAHCDHFHLLKNPTVGSRNRLILTFVFDVKPANDDIGIIIFRLIEEEFHLQKYNMKRIGCSEKFAVKILMYSCYAEKFHKEENVYEKDFVIFTANAKTSILFLF